MSNWNPNTQHGQHKTSKDGKRLLWFVPPRSMRPVDDALAGRLRSVVPSTCLDHCHIPGRGLAAAEALIQPGWQFLDVRDAYASVYMPRLWPILRRLDQVLHDDVHRFLGRLGCADQCLPDGASVSHPLFNIYLASIDARWQGRAVRYADNIACEHRQRMRKELHDIGLRTSDQASFTHHDTIGGLRPLEASDA